MSEGYGLAKGIRAALAAGWVPARGAYLWPPRGGADGPGRACALGLMYAGTRPGPWHCMPGDSYAAHRWAHSLLGASALEGMEHGFDGRRHQPPLTPALARRYGRGYRAGVRLARVLIEGRAPFGGVRRFVREAMEAMEEIGG